MGIAALGIAVAYLLLLVAGAAGALFALVWLFGDTTNPIEKIEREETEFSRNAPGVGRQPSLRVDPGRREDAAA